MYTKLNWYFGANPAWDVFLRSFLMTGLLIGIILTTAFFKRDTIYNFIKGEKEKVEDIIETKKDKKK
jgi:hypothetical protein